jgi:NTP pyrophosphatase (non-canonical NTP hydrolase)
MSNWFQIEKRLFEMRDEEGRASADPVRWKIFVKEWNDLVDKTKTIAGCSIKWYKRMTFVEYTDFVKGMKVYPEKYKIIYPAMKLNGEAGEVAEKVGKWMRGDKGELDKTDMLKELGDVLWYVTSMADDFGATLEDVVNMNVEKLTKRKEQGLIKGDGDNREVKTKSTSGKETK